ncbi:dual specificity phosphatase [Colletotrichum graminicola]|uniref:protein-tyrosine-phosphatase n=1 Tax=Colletotrichum graminicola (strain M1.001 / M2 / FGSC 10212) TaxID=645133 RepID=E3QC64_COLGM|nr:dual specificity phosphatase [Colletotrichum graminicola M1.001]EFQ28452.1 dual specificity phosphatase [Colletotrichum graminicola M1.001]WDK16104.1 dual specificity phosphatase [Colletotrichum graminicola]
MPSAAARRIYEDQIPSFMSVFDLDAETIAAQETVTLVDPKLIEMEATGKPLGDPIHHLRASMPSDPTHKHHDSTSTQASESAESSPTTTLSTSDCSPLSDPSPSSSPDSPVNLIPLSSYPATSFGGLSPMSAMNTFTAAETTSFGRPMTSPSPRRPKNMKGLSIQPPFVSNSVATLVSEPASPSFIKPTIPAMKRKPSQLSLNTQTSDLVMRNNTLEVPGTPGMPPMLQRRALKHSTSSPHMLPSLKSATFGPAGGMTFPKVLERNESGLSEFLRPTKTGIGSSFDTAIVEEESPIKTQLASRAALDFEPFHEIENNEDQKTPGYPDGPIAIYEDNVYLYLEPTAEEASKFDTVINVAREVNNPFAFLPKPDESMSDSPVASPIPDTALSNASFSTAFEFPTLERTETPTTPKGTSFSIHRPEYIHMPWDHNTDIAQDLMHLCETIDARTKEGKRVLVHCQQGASRSASLIIAYGMYRNPELSVNDAYYAAQGKSKWISPNMKLMYCLQDFQKQVSKKKGPPGSAFRPRAGRSPTKHRLTLSVDAAMELAPKEPLTAPLPGEQEGSSGNASPKKGSPTRGRGHSTPGNRPISPGPSSAPSSFSWSENKTNPVTFATFDVDRLLPSKPEGSVSGLAPSSSSFPAKPPPSPGFGAHRFGPSAGFGFSSLNLGPSLGHEMEIEHTIRKELPRAMIGAMPADTTLMSPRAEEMTKNPLHDSCSDFPGMQFIEVPPTPNEGLFSPRQTMFPRDPFYPFGRPAQVADPRSPPTRGETPIVRSIDELL